MIKSFYTLGRHHSILFNFKKAYGRILKHIFDKIPMLCYGLSFV